MLIRTKCLLQDHQLFWDARFADVFRHDDIVLRVISSVRGRAASSCSLPSNRRAANPSKSISSSVFSCRCQLLALSPAARTHTNINWRGNLHWVYFSLITSQNAAESLIEFQFFGDLVCSNTDGAPWGRANSCWLAGVWRGDMIRRSS